MEHTFPMGQQVEATHGNGEKERGVIIGVLLAQGVFVKPNGHKPATYCVSFPETPTSDSWQGYYEPAQLSNAS